MKLGSQGRKRTIAPANAIAASRTIARRSSATSQTGTSATAAPIPKKMPQACV